MIELKTGLITAYQSAENKVAYLADLPSYKILEIIDQYLAHSLPVPPELCLGASQALNVENFGKSTHKVEVYLNRVRVIVT